MYKQVDYKEETDRRRARIMQVPAHCVPPTVYTRVNLPVLILESVWVLELRL